MFVEITPYQNNLYKIVGLAHEKRIDNGRIAIPIEQIKNLTDENRKLMMEHLPLALPCIQKVDETAYEFVHSVDNAKALKLKNLQNRTQQMISSRMPDWKLNRLRAYYSLSKKVQQNGIESLDEIEKAEYDVYPSQGETHEECFNYARATLLWVFDRIKIHSEVEQQIIKAKTLGQIKEINVQKSKLKTGKM